jgi:tRNA G18 (ribose-2'-O)-methylase SpoU
MRSPLPADLELDALTPYRQLASRKRGDFFVVEGELAVRRLLESSLDWELHSLIGTAPRLERLEASVNERCPVYLAEHGQLRALTGFDFHRGVLAAARRRRAWGWDDARAIYGSNALPLTVVVIHGIADPPNLGAIIRNARALGAGLCLIDGRAADPFAGKAIRASAGQLFDLPSKLYRNLEELGRELDELECELWGAALGESSQVLSEKLTDIPARVALAIGNEGQGLDASFQARCDRLVHVPMDAGVDSLNAAAASAVMLYTIRLGRSYFLPPK